MHMVFRCLPVVMQCDYLLIFQDSQINSLDCLRFPAALGSLTSGVKSAMSYLLLDFILGARHSVQCPRQTRRQSTVLSPGGDRIELRTPSMRNMSHDCHGHNRLEHFVSSQVKQSFFVICKWNICVSHIEAKDDHESWMCATKSDRFKIYSMNATEYRSYYRNVLDV